MLNISHISFSFSIGGIENLVVDILNEQSKKANVSLIIVNKKYNQELLNRISNKVNIILLNRPQNNNWNVFYIIRLWIYLYKFNAQVIHCHTPNLIRLLFPFKNKCIYTIHNVGIPLRFIKKYKKIYSISKSVKSDLKKRGNINSTLIYNGINFSNFSKRNDYSLKGNKIFKIAQIGRLLHSQKGQDILIRSFHSLVNDYKIKNIRLDIIGDGPSQKYLSDLIIKYQLKEFISLTGAKDRTWIYKNLCNYHLLIQPSRFEGFGLSIIEAIAAGLPVIASDIDGPAEILKGVPSAFMFETENINELTTKIIHIIDNYTNIDLSEKCKSAIDKIEHTFSVESTVKLYLQQYEEFARRK